MTRMTRRDFTRTATGAGVAAVTTALSANRVLGANDRLRLGFIGLGRMVLSYPELPADVLAGRSLARKRICRTFSDCTTAPRNGLVSGCFPLDPFYKERPEREQLALVKRAAAGE